MNRQQIMVTIIAVATLSVLTTSVVVNGIYQCGGVDDYVISIIRAILGRGVAQ